jgi:nucleotide-binding universal stress UspA family protein
MWPSIKKVLVPVDFSTCSKSALELALVFQQRFGAQLELFHAWEAPAGADSMQVGTGGSLAQFLGGQAEEAMRALEGELHQRGVKDFHASVVRGDPHRMIVAESGTYDLIVMGTHGRGGLKRLVVGSVAERVVRHAKCAVLTVGERETQSGS